YNVLGWKLSESEWASTPGYNTLFQYDAFGRPIRITAPDQSAVSMSYVGGLSTSKTASLVTGGTASSPTASSVTTIETYDRQGQLYQIQEPSGTITQYSYDVGGRLKKVCAKLTGTTCGQSRTFTYDNRGLLTSETQPEKGTTSYPMYDARGHAIQRTDAKFNLTFEYDRAERLKKIRETTGARALKEFFFGIDNSSN